jgi:hypothetical protein
LIALRCKTFRGAEAFTWINSFVAVTAQTEAGNAACESIDVCASAGTVTTVLDAAITEIYKQRLNEWSEGFFAFGMAAIP